MKNRTAVQWLIDNLKDVRYNPLEKNGYIMAKQRIIEKAKQLEREQIEDAFRLGKWNGWELKDKESILLDPKKYYEERYGCEK